MYTLEAMSASASQTNTVPTNAVGIVGYGYLGKAMARFFSRQYPVRVYDPYANPHDPLPPQTQWASREEINGCQVAWVCVPTPSDPSRNFACDTSAVEEVVGWLETPLIAVGSTVEVGTTDRLRQTTGKPIVFSPAYVGETTYWSPHKLRDEVIEAPFFIFGGDPQDTRRAVELFLPLAGPYKVYRQVPARTAEMAKYMENTYLALKVAFVYEMAQISQTLGVDFYEARELWLLDPRTDPGHTGVFSTNQAPFAGKCLPKDLAALIALAREKGFEPTLLAALENTNNQLSNLRGEAPPSV